MQPLTTQAPASATVGPGIWIEESAERGAAQRMTAFSDGMNRLGLAHGLQLVPDNEALRLHWHLACAGGSTPTDDGNVTREILGRMLSGPVAFCFPSLAELKAHIEMRVAIVNAARHTELSFSTQAADRPPSLWVEKEAGFAIRAGTDLLTALRAATQPKGDDPRYAFSCYRASEYAMLTGIAEVMVRRNPKLYARLNALSEHCVIKSRAFHDTFLIEYGDDQTLPHDYYVPGDRVWFKNPDEASANVSGYEGSWTIYLGGGLFANFWRREAPYTLSEKCLEIYHWRHGVEYVADGTATMNESKVAQLCERSRNDPVEWAQIMALMQRPRDPSGVYANGGCIDRTREYPRWILPRTCNMPLGPQALGH